MSIASLQEDAAGLSEFGCDDVKQSGSWHEGQQRQVLFQLVQSGDRDDAVSMQQPVAEQDDETLLLGNQIFKRLCSKEMGYGKSGQRREITHTHVSFQTQTNMCSNDSKPDRVLNIHAYVCVCSQVIMFVWGLSTLPAR